MRIRNWLSSVKFDPTGELATAIAIAALAIAGPTAGLIYFMHRSLQGERETLVAARAATRRVRVEEARDAIREQLTRLAATPVDDGELTLPPGRLFLRVMDSHRSDSCLILDRGGQIAFPILPTPVPLVSGPSSSKEAGLLLRDFHQPVKKFSDGWPQLMDRFRGRRLWGAAAPSGRLYGPLLQLATLNQLPASDPRAGPIIEALSAQVQDYDNLSLPSTQRLYLAARLKERVPDFALPTQEAERTAIIAADHFLRPKQPGMYEVTAPDSQLVQVRTDSPQIVLLYHIASLKRTLENTAATVLEPEQFRAEVITSPTVSSEESEAVTTTASMTLGKVLRSWQIIAHDDFGIHIIDSMVQSRRWQYSVVAVGGGLLLNVLAALAIQRFTRTANLTQARQDFLSTLSHELRTPLTSIRMFVDTLADGGLEDPTRARTYLDFIRRENERLSRLAENFLTFTRLESGRMNFDLQEINPEEVVESARVAVETRFAVEGTEFQMSIERKLPTIKADHTLLTTAVVNLLENAFKYTPPTNKRILLSVSRGHNTVRFTVADNGQGLTPDQQKRIGEKFYRPDAVARSGQPGFGLGLNIVSHIIAAHRGRMEIHTEAGVGSRFTLILPQLEDVKAQDPRHKS